MKKITAVLLAALLVITLALTAHAGINEDRSVRALDLAISMIKDHESAEIIIDFDKSCAMETSEGRVAVWFESALPTRFLMKDMELAHKLIVAMWEPLNEIHTRFSSAEFYVVIGKNDEIVLMTDGVIIIDGDKNMWYADGSGELL